MKKLCFYVIILGVVCWFAGFLAFNYNINNYKIDNKTKTDAIVALTGGKNRIAEAAQMMEKGARDSKVTGAFCVAFSIKLG